MLAALLAASLPAQAFMPSPWYPVPGSSHPTMTLDALDRIYAAYGYGPGLKPYTKSMKDARKNIADGSADTDSSSSGLSQKPNYHCDDEQLQECSGTVKSDTDMGIAGIRLADYDGARLAIGRVVHTLQDFYSHSNWVEMRGGVVNPQMGYGSMDNVAPKNENTCTYSIFAEWFGPTISCFIMRTDNTVTYNLTSGYYKGEGIDIPSRVNKCFHGGSFDGYGKQGINKDAAVCSMGVVVVSPHAAWHAPAVTAATAATVQYFNDIRSRVGEDGFKNFLGFGTTVGFAITTASGITEDDIAGVKSSVKSTTISRPGADGYPSKYVRTIIKGPVVPQTVKKAGYSAFLGSLNSRHPGYSNDCQELYGQGVYNTASALDRQSTLFAYANASIKDPVTSSAARMLAVSRNIGVNVVVAGNCSGGPKSADRSKDFNYSDLHDSIAELTGGQVFLANPSEAARLTKLSDVFSNNYYARLMSIHDTLASGAVKSYEFPVDSTMDTLSITSSMRQGANIAVFRPDGSAVGSGDAGVNVLALSRTVAYQIDKPAAGTWKVALDGSGRFTVNVGGNSPVMFNWLDFVALEGGQDKGYFPVRGYPMAGVRQNIEATISGDTSDVHLEFRARDGTPLGSMTGLMTNVTPGAQTLLAGLSVDLPAQPFRVYAVGKNAGGMPFERVLGKLIVPQTVAVTGPGSQNLPRDTDTTYVFKVTNHGAADNFTLAAVDDQGFVTGLTPTAVFIGAGETMDVSVVLNPGAASAPGTVSTATFMALPASNPNALGNYATVAGTVVDQLGAAPAAAPRSDSGP